MNHILLTEQKIMAAKPDQIVQYYHNLEDIFIDNFPHNFISLLS